MKTHTPALLVLLGAVALVVPSSSAAAWGPTADLSGTGQNALTFPLNRQAALDPKGDAFAVWSRSDGANSIVQVAVMPAKSLWSAPHDLSAAGHDAFTPAVAADAKGNAIAVWKGDDGTNTIVEAAAKPAKSAWGARVPLSAAGEDAKAPDIAIDPKGNAVAVWLRSDGANWIAQASVRPAKTGVWSSPIDLSAAGEDVVDVPRVAVDPKGNAAAVWARSNGTNTIVQVSLKPAKGSWTAPDNLSASGQDAHMPDVVLDAKGNATAAWHRSDGTKKVVQASRRAAKGDGQWSAPAPLSDDAQDATQLTRLAVDRKGGVFAVWTWFDGTTERAQTARWDAKTATWSGALNLSAAGHAAEASGIGVDNKGNAVAAWARNDGTNLIAQASTWDAKAGTWSSPIDLSAAGKDADYPSLAVNGKGVALATWDRSNGTNTIIQARFGP